MIMAIMVIMNTKTITNNMLMHITMITRYVTNSIAVFNRMYKLSFFALKLKLFDLKVPS